MCRFAFAVVLLGVGHLHAQTPDFAKARLDNWHHWRGPEANGTGPKADPPITWDATKNIKWKAPLPGRGSATPIVWGQQVFVVTAIDTGRVAAAADVPKADPTLKRKTTAPKTYHQFVVLCFDRDSGKLLWQRQAAEKVPHEGHHQSHSYAAGSPTTDGKFLYVSFGSFGISCYDLAGKLQWERDFGRMNTRLAWGEAVTPVIHGDRLLLNWDQEKDAALICLEASTGKTLWKTPRDEVTSWNTPLVVEHKGRTQVIVNGTNRCRGYDLETGKEIWQCGPMTVNAIPSPVAADGIAYCMSGYQTSTVFAIPLDSTGDVGGTKQLAWQYGKGTPYVPSPLLLGDRLVFTQANVALLTILDRKTGQPIVDRERLPGQQSFYASPAAAAGRIYLVDRDGTTLVLKAGDKLEVLATNPLDDRVDASPVLVGKQLFLRGERFLYCIENAGGNASLVPVEPKSFQHARVTDAWAAYQGKLTFGKGQTLALLDDGCKLSMPEWSQSDGAKPKVIATYDSVDGDDDPKHEGRGYHGSTIGIPSSLNYKGTMGVAFNNQVAVVRALECCHCNVKDSKTLAAGLQWVIDHHAKYRITAVNLAPVDDLEHGQPVPTEIDAKLKRLRELGIWVSAPAGNHNFTKGISWPACQPHCFAIGAVTPGNDQVFLDRSAKIDLVVPASATSSSNAIVCGAVLLLREAINQSGYDWKKDGPTLPDAMMAILQRTGPAVHDPATKWTFRRLDVKAALDQVFEAGGK